MTNIKVTLFSLSLFSILSCVSTDSKTRLETGDLLFREKTSGNISQAIDKVTQTSAETHFSHVGLVVTSDSGIKVLHADPEGGTCEISLEKFLHPEGDSVIVIAYRLKKEWQKTIPEAIEKARRMLGKPYNFSYLLSDTAHYCSEFIYRSFAADSVFTLEPMTFKDPLTGDFFPTWVDYYHKMGIEIPEGQPGCNPNGLAVSKKLERRGEIK